MLLDSPASGDPRQFHHHHNSSMSSPGQLSDHMHMLGGGHLTSEDEERRRRRRERNKVAATKCRNRKKERTGILMQESDVLEDQNGSFRSEIQRLESEKRRLMDVLAMHSTNCNLTSQKAASGSSSTSAGGGTAAGASIFTYKQKKNPLSRWIKRSFFIKTAEHFFYIKQIGIKVLYYLFHFRNDSISRDNFGRKLINGAH